MRQTVPKVKKAGAEHRRLSWKRRPSEIRGYQRTMYLNADNGDYLRVDYNLKEKKVRLYIEDSEEGGNPYYAVITNGKIVAERNASTGRSCSLDDKFSRRADVFSTLNHREVFALINNNYGISPDRGEKLKRARERKQQLERTRERYFKPEEMPQTRIGREDVPVQKKRLIDLIDLFIGLNICLAFYYFYRMIFIAGIIAAFFGVLIGLIDIFIRDREPVFSKVLFFIFLGAALYIYGYYLG
jgi:hypothetical protein